MKRAKTKHFATPTKVCGQCGKKKPVVEFASQSLKCRVCMRLNGARHVVGRDEESEEVDGVR